MVDEDEIDETTSLSTMGPGHQQGVVFATDSCHQTGVCQIKVFVVLGVQTSTDSWSRDTVSWLIQKWKYITKAIYLSIYLSIYIDMYIYIEREKEKKSHVNDIHMSLITNWNQSHIPNQAACAERVRQTCAWITCPGQSWPCWRVSRGVHTNLCSYVCIYICIYILVGGFNPSEEYYIITWDYYSQ